MSISLNIFLKNILCDYFLLFRSLARDSTLSGIHRSQNSIASTAQATTYTLQAAVQKVFNLQFTLYVTQVDSLNVFLKPSFVSSIILYSVVTCLFCSALICSVPKEQLTRCQLITQMGRNRYSDDCTT